MATARMTRTPCRPATRRLSSARKPADDAGADLPAGARRAARGADIPRHLRRCRARARVLARQHRLQPRILPMPRTNPPSWVKLTPTIVMLIGLWIAWNNYIRDARARRTASSRNSPRSTGSSPTNGISTSSTISCSSARRSGSAACCGRAVTKARSTASARTARLMRCGIGNRVTARLQSGYLYSYALVMLLGLIGAASWAIWWAQVTGLPLLTILIAIPLIAGGLCLFLERQWRALDRAGRDADRLRPRHLPVGRTTIPSGAAVAVRRERRRSAAGSAGRSASTASRWC